MHVRVYVNIYTPTFHLLFRLRCSLYIIEIHMSLINYNQL